MDPYISNRLWFVLHKNCLKIIEFVSDLQCQFDLMFGSFSQKGLFLDLKVKKNDNNTKRF